MKISTNYSSNRLKQNHTNFGMALHTDIPKITAKIGHFAGEEAKRILPKLQAEAENCEAYIIPIRSLMQAPELDRAVVVVLPKGSKMGWLDYAKVRLGLMGTPVHELNRGGVERLTSTVQAEKKALAIT